PAAAWRSITGSGPIPETSSSAALTRGRGRFPSGGTVRRRRPAYTLLELLLVVAVLTLLIALSVPSLDVMGSNLPPQATAHSVRAAWAPAGGGAIDGARPYRSGIIPDQGNSRAAPDSPDFWNGGDPPQPNDPAHPPLVVEKSLPKGIRFSGLNVG